MKTAVIISDTHGNMPLIKKLYPLFYENDYIFHIGDGLNDLASLPEELKNKVISVQGNCDVTDAPKERMIEIEGVKIFMAHGHEYGVKGSPYKLLLKGKEVGADVCFYGHNHRADITKEEGIYLINPGTLTRYAANKSFCYCAFSNGKLTAKINETFFL